MAGEVWEPLTGNFRCRGKPMAVGEGQWKHSKTRSSPVSDEHGKGNHTLAVKLTMATFR